jgi:hypothetical protein
MGGPTQALLEQRGEQGHAPIITPDSMQAREPAPAPEPRTSGFDDKV